MSALRPKLAWQIFPYFLLITVLSLCGLGWYASQRLHDFHLEQLGAELEGRANLLRDLVAPHFQHDLEAVASICAQASEDTRSRATVVLPGGAVIGESHRELSEVKNHAARPEIVTALAGNIGHSSRVSETTGLHTLYVAVPVRVGGAIVGVARMAVSTAGIDKTLNGLYRQFAGAGLGMAALAAVLVWWTSRRIAAPLPVPDTSRLTAGSRSCSDNRVWPWALIRKARKAVPRSGEAAARGTKATRGTTTV